VMKIVKDVAAMHGVGRSWGGLGASWGGLEASWEGFGEV
jgi:hypothetical protein